MLDIKVGEKIKSLVSEDGGDNGNRIFRHRLYEVLEILNEGDKPLEHGDMNRPAFIVRPIDQKRVPFPYVWGASKFVKANQKYA